jgi:environmental stress-induced protein Ves
MRIVRQASLLATPWKNGGGLTREAIRVPSDRDPFGWRVSFAQIDRSGPFSDFSGYVRHMVLLRGAGMHLDFADGTRARLREVGDTVQFDGAVATSCELLKGSCMDLNLIVSRALHTASAQVARVCEPVVLRSAAGTAVLVVAIDGSVIVQDARGESARLGPWDMAVGAAPGGIGALRAADQGAPCRVFVAEITDNKTIRR